MNGLVIVRGEADGIGAVARAEADREPRTRDRLAVLRDSTNSLIYGKIQGNSPVMAPPCPAGVKFPIAHQPEAAVFPTRGNRELFIRNREFRDGNRDGRGIFSEDFRVKAPGPRGASIEGGTHASVLLGIGTSHPTSPLAVLWQPTPLSCSV